MIFIMLFVLFIFFGDFSSMINYSYAWVFGLYIWVVLSLVVFYIKYYKKYLKDEKIIFDKSLFFEILKYAVVVFLWVQVSVILSQIDMQMVLFMLWAQDAWYYTNYLSIIWIPFMIIGPIFMLLLPIFSQLNSNWQQDKIKLIKSIFQKNFLVVWFAFNVLFFVFATVIATILFGDKFFESGVILTYSILFLVFNFLLQINFNILWAIWKVKDRLYIILWALVFNIILNIIFIKLIWVYGAALATWIGWVFIWILCEWKLKDFRIWFDFWYLIKNIVFLSFIWLGMYYFLLPLFDWFSRLEWFFMLGLISLVYFASFVWFNWKDFRYFYDEVRKLRKGV